MAIYSPCSDLTTRALLWCPRKAGTDENYSINPEGIDAVWIASQSSIKYADEAKAVCLD